MPAASLATSLGKWPTKTLDPVEEQQGSSSGSNSLHKRVSENTSSETVWKFLRTRTLEFLSYENGAKEAPFCLSILLSRLGQGAL